MLLVAREGDAPLDRGSGDAEVLQAGAEPAKHLVAPSVRLDEVRMLFQVLLETVLVVGQLEEVVLLLEPLGLERGVDQAVTVFEVGVLLEGLTGDAIPALVRPLVDVAV